MNRRLMPFWKVSAVATITATLALSGCARDSGDAGAGSTGAGSTAAAASTILPGALTKDILAYSSKDLYDFVETLDSVPGPDQPRCTAAPPGCNPTTIAQITAFKGQALVGPLDAEGNGFGTIVMRIRNKGTRDESRYDLKPGDHMYYMVARYQGGTMQWKLYQIPAKNAAAAPTLHKEGNWHACGHPTEREAYGEFASCAGKAQTPQAMADPRDPAWMTCSDGCCTAGEV